MVTVSKESKHKGLNWDILRAKVKRGMRNATLMAIAPNANIGLVAGTTPGMDPRFAQVFSRNKISGKYMDINHNLVRDLKNLSLWEKVREQIIESQGDIADIAGIPQHIKDVYKTSFTTSPYAFIEVAARAQKWIDQGISRNMYLETRDVDETMKIYTAAWEKGVKTTYYLHMKPRHTAEQSTVRVNKAEKMGKTGFGAVSVNMSEKKAVFDAPLQISLDIVEPAPMVAVTPAPIMAEVPKAPSVQPVLSAQPVAFRLPKQAAMSVASASTHQASFAVSAANAALAAVEASVPVSTSSAKPSGYQSLSDLANIAGAGPRSTPVASMAAAKPRVIMTGNKTCPTDPSELAQCHSCQ
jgi:ribonucleoside-diphosphate reductase alpha chain